MSAPVLVIDDNPVILSMVTFALEQEGFNPVLGFTDPRIALSSSEELSTTPGLVITDYSMPHLKGDELLKALTLRFPGLPAIVMSAEPHEADIACGAYRVIDKGIPDLLPTLIKLAHGILDK